MDWSQVLSAILKSPAVWTAIVALLNALQIWLFPNVPSAVMLAVNALIAAIGGVFGVIVTSYNVGHAKGLAVNAKVVPTGKK